MDKLNDELIKLQSDKAKEQKKIADLMKEKTRCLNRMSRTKSASTQSMYSKKAQRLESKLVLSHKKMAGIESEIHKAYKKEYADAWNEAEQLAKKINSKESKSINPETEGKYGNIDNNIH